MSALVRGGLMGKLRSGSATGYIWCVDIVAGDAVSSTTQPLVMQNLEGTTDVSFTRNETNILCNLLGNPLHSQQHTLMPVAFWRAFLVTFCL